PTHRPAAKLAVPPLLLKCARSVVLPVDHFVVWCKAFDAKVSRTPAPIALRKPVKSPRLTVDIKPNSRIHVPLIASATHTLLLLLYWSIPIRSSRSPGSKGVRPSGCSTPKIPRRIPSAIHVDCRIPGISRSVSSGLLR
ncbi:unnamed protein product, partial [Ectocarpus sp. 12 AP-2014]